MTGPEHYREAERFVREALDGNFVGYGRENHLAAAQVHATLALAAAQAGATLGMTGVPSAEWSKALS